MAMTGIDRNAGLAFVLHGAFVVAEAPKRIGYAVLKYRGVASV